MGLGIRTKLNSLFQTPAAKNVEFAPYIKDLPIDGCLCRFFYGTPQAQEWYDPLKPYAKAEYDWVVKHVDMRNQIIIDGGAHHGQYSVVFAVASANTAEVISVDPVASNCALVEINMMLNGAKSRIEQCAISDSTGYILFSLESNGHIVQEGGRSLPSKRLSEISKDATIVKLDVEGAEFSILPAAINEMSAVHTWILEIHPGGTNDPNVLIDLLKKSGFDLLWVNRETSKVEPYPEGADWESHATVFALRK